MDIFGFEINRKKEDLRVKDVQKKSQASFVAPVEDDGTPIIQQSSGGFISGGAYGSYVDMEGGIKNEVALIQRYRETSLVPECDIAIDDIVNECIVSDIKTIEKHGYSSLQLVSINGKKEIKKLKKPQQKIFADLKINPKKIIKEFRVDQDNILDIGSTLNVSHFKTDQFVDVTSVSIGKGFAGAMKRHNFGGLRASHGVSISHRSHGSTGQCQDPGRVFKGKKMAGQMGDVHKTLQNLQIVKVDVKKNIVCIKGATPGARGAWLVLEDSIKNKPNKDVDIKLEVESKKKK